MELTTDLEENSSNIKINDNLSDEKFILSTDPTVLRVRGSGNDSASSKKPTDPVALSRAILHVLSQHDHVRILSVGPKAFEITMKAFRLAAQQIESRTNGAVLVCRQSEYEAIVADNKTKGISTRIFGIPIKNAL
jgi:stage V sporulation protein SpoVS